MRDTPSRTAHETPLPAPNLCSRNIDSANLGVPTPEQPVVCLCASLSHRKCAICPNYARHNSPSAAVGSPRGRLTVTWLCVGLPERLNEQRHFQLGMACTQRAVEPPLDRLQVAFDRSAGPLRVRRRLSRRCIQRRSRRAASRARPRPRRSDSRAATDGSPLATVRTPHPSAPRPAARHRRGSSVACATRRASRPTDLRPLPRTVSLASSLVGRAVARCPYLPVVAGGLWT